MSLGRAPPPTHKVRAQHLPTTVAFTFPWSSSFHSSINTFCLQLFKSFTDKWSRQTIADHLWKYTCPSLNEWRLIKPCDWLWEREGNSDEQRVGGKWEVEGRAESRAGKEKNWIRDKDWVTTSCTVELDRKREMRQPGRGRMTEIVKWGRYRRRWREKGRQSSGLNRKRL